MELIFDEGEIQLSQANKFIMKGTRKYKKHLHNVDTDSNQQKFANLLEI